MAFAVSITRSFVPGDRRSVTVVCTGATGYSTGGYTITPSTHLGLASIDHGISLGATSGVHGVYDSGTGKLLFITTNTGAQVAAASDQSAQSVSMSFSGPPA